MNKPMIVAGLLLILSPTTGRAAEPRHSQRVKYMLAQPDATAPAPIITAGADRVADEYIIVLQDDIPANLMPEIANDIATSVSADVRKVWSHVVKAFFASMAPQQANALTHNPLVKFIEENSKWYLSGLHQQTNIDPRFCDPTVGSCPPVADDRLWHLDRADQNDGLVDKEYTYCSDGSGVTVYVVDTGVDKNHNEFTGSNRVQPGFNAAGDLLPADDPCLGFSVAPQPYTWEVQMDLQQTYSSGHGTSVASVLGGKRIGIAKNVTIVPVKTARCDEYSARYRIAAHYYQQNQTIGLGSTMSKPTDIWYAANAGYSAGTDPGGWYSVGIPAETVIDGEVTWKLVPRSTWDVVQSTQMIIDGLDWVYANRVSGPAIVTLSTYRRAVDPQVGGTSNTLEESIRNLLSVGVTVIASANNQNGNACDTSPARMSRDNPDPAVANDVITVGGTMIVNRPWAVDISDVSDPHAHEADGGGGTYTTEAPYVLTKAVREARWICGSGDADTCSNIPSPTCTGDLWKCTLDPADPNPSPYYNFTAGSNAGPCVTLFAPAKNLFSATLAASSGYRDARLRGSYASGTSFSAPIVAGFAARILQNNRSFTPPQVRAALLSNSISTLDTQTLDSYDSHGNPITGTPNKVIRLSDVNITIQPQSHAAAPGGTALAVVAGGTSNLGYQWYRVNTGFDLATYMNGAFSSTPIAGATNPTYDAPSSPAVEGYWCRVKATAPSCGTADSDIAVVVPVPGAPSNTVATAAGITVTVTWS